MGLRTLLLLAALAAVLSFVGGQGAIEKPGSCPPKVGATCVVECKDDFSCSGRLKCCLTGCGGSVCVSPVTKLIGAPAVKPGSCPSAPTGPWVCSHMCSNDADCRGRLKCCRNRCKALTCQKPEL